MIVTTRTSSNTSVVLYHYLYNYVWVNYLISHMRVAKEWIKFISLANTITNLN